MIKLASPDINSDDIDNVVSVLKTGNLVQGINVEILERDISLFTGIKGAVAVSSGTAALHLALLTLGIGEGDSVIAPSFTFPATVNAIEVVGAETILCDVDPESYSVTIEKLRRTIEDNKSKNIKAIIIVHEFGYPVPMAEVKKLADENDLYIIEDAACALGSISDDYHVGYYSDWCCFSFHPRKAITSGEGGMMVSNNEDLIESAKMLRNHGIVRASRIDFLSAGLNYRLTDFQAAMVIGQLQRFKAELSRREQIAKYYCNELKSLRNLTLPQNPKGHSWQSFMVVLDSKLERSKIISELKDAGIECGIGAQSIGDLTYYRDKYSFNKTSYSVANLLYEKGLVLPIYGKLSDVNLQYIVNKVSAIVQ